MLFPKDISCCLITKETHYPEVILTTLAQVGFGEILILANSDSPFRKYELFAKAKHDLIYYQDDDAIVPVGLLLGYSRRETINLLMKPSHYHAHMSHKATMGLGWGATFDRKILESLKRYTDKYGEDDVYKRETERILTALNYPQNRIMTEEIYDLPSAMAEDRLWRQPHHNEYKAIAEERCKTL